jgi:hypothetical protein
MTGIQQSKTGNCKGDVIEAKSIRVNLRSSAVRFLFFRLYSCPFAVVRCSRPFAVEKGPWFLDS